MTSGRCWASPPSKSSRDRPLCDDRLSIWSAPSALARSLGEIVLFGPLPTHVLAVSPWPFCCNCLSRSPSPPEITLPAAPPASRPPSGPFSTSPRPPPIPPPPVPPPGEGAGCGAALGGPALKCLIAFQASRPRIAMVIGDMPPPDCALGVLGPRGPFCMPLSTSSKPIVSSRRSLPPPKQYRPGMTVTRHRRWLRGAAEIRGINTIVGNFSTIRRTMPPYIPGYYQTRRDDRRIPPSCKHPGLPRSE